MLQTETNGKTVEKEKEKAIDLFLASIRSPETKMCYSIYFKKYQDFIGFGDLFCQNNPRTIEAKIIEFTTNMKNEEKGYSTNKLRL